MVKGIQKVKQTKKEKEEGGKEERQRVQSEKM